MPPPPITVAAGGGRGVDECDMSSGRWVYDEEAYALYKESACRFMSENLACGRYGRTDLRYQHWRWQPHGCDLPRYVLRLLEKLRGKQLAFVGDSLNRNQWVSMVCLIDTATQGLHKTLISAGTLVSFNVHMDRYQEYNASVDFYWSPLLVESNSDHPVRHRVIDRTVDASCGNLHARHWTYADVLVFNSYLWWRRPSIEVRWGSFEAPAAKEDEYCGVTKAVDGVRTFELALATWADWLEFHVGRARTRLFFMTMSPTHLPSDEWADDAGGGTSHGCYNETEPIAAAEEGGRYQRGVTDPAFARAVEEQARRGVTAPAFAHAAEEQARRLVNVTAMSERRKDAHPSVHRRQWEPITDAQARDASSYADCIHRCLPGVPDVWNQLLYAHIVS
ncbi:protein trichome birefringence-like 34 [Triticum dicoccoides]|uniref:protein trichome birefringence-like 34 n=1 Tax=Triticum dicoccoides TaxID=85692 RepID=UPI00188DF30A|nr:protein trichome birefringence-like 34 [Triticum dicoccoides]